MVAALDLAEHADAAQEMLVDRVVMIHLELHHRHHLAEIGHETPEHAAFVHAPQHDLGVVFGGENFAEEGFRFLVLAQRSIDQLERLRRAAKRIRMEREDMPLGKSEHADEIDRIAGKHFRSPRC